MRVMVALLSAALWAAVAVGICCVVTLVELVGDGDMVKAARSAALLLVFLVVAWATGTAVVRVVGGWYGS